MVIWPDHIYAHVDVDLLSPVVEWIQLLDKGSEPLLLWPAPENPQVQWVKWLTPKVIYNGTSLSSITSNEEAETEEYYGDWKGALWHT